MKNLLTFIRSGRDFLLNSLLLVIGFSLIAAILIPVVSIAIKLLFKEFSWFWNLI